MQFALNLEFFIEMSFYPLQPSSSLRYPGQHVFSFYPDESIYQLEELLLMIVILSTRNPLRPSLRARSPQLVVSTREQRLAWSRACSEMENIHPGKNRDATFRHRRDIQIKSASTDAHYDFFHREGFGV